MRGITLTTNSQMVQEKEIVSFLQGLGKFEIAITVVCIVNFIIEDKMKCLNSEVS